MSITPVLRLPDFNEPFSIFTDASGLGMGAVLEQKGHLIAFFGKKFYPKLTRSSTYVRELHAITTGIHKWRQYLLGREFTIYTDQKSIQDLMNQVIQIQINILFVEAIRIITKFVIDLVEITKSLMHCHRWNLPQPPFPD